MGRKRPGAVWADPAVMDQWDLKFHMGILSKFETEFSLLCSQARHTSGELSYGIFHRLSLWPNAASSAFSIITSLVWATGVPALFHRAWARLLWGGGEPIHANFWCGDS